MPTSEVERKMTFFPSHLARTSPHCRDEFGTEACYRTRSAVTKIQLIDIFQLAEKTPFGVFIEVS